MAEFISAVAGALQATLGGMLSRSQVVLDRGFPPERREEVVDKVLKFVDERPVLAVCRVFLFLPHNGPPPSPPKGGGVVITQTELSTKPLY